jgi:hypothetical protein
VKRSRNIAVVGREQEPFRPPLDAPEALAVEGPKRRVDRLQRRDVGRAGLLDGMLLDERVEPATPRLDLGQLGQGLVSGV